MKTYLIEVVETHQIYVDANSEKEALKRAEEKVYNNVPDSVESKVLLVE